VSAEPFDIADGFRVWVKQHPLLKPYAALAWLCYMAVTAAASAYTAISGPILGTWLGDPLVPGGMFILGWYWLILGLAVGGWTRREQ
jgi:hypothetical protein